MISVSAYIERVAEAWPPLQPNQVESAARILAGLDTTELSSPGSAPSP